MKTKRNRVRKKAFLFIPKKDWNYLTLERMKETWSPFSPHLYLWHTPKWKENKKHRTLVDLRGLWRINFKNRSFASLKKAKSVRISSFCCARPFFFKIFLSKSSSWKSYTTVHLQCGKARVCWLMLPEVSLLTGLTQERIWQNYLFPGPGAGAASTPPHFMNCQLMAAGCARQIDWEDVNPLSSGEDSKTMAM